jgi:hypothetical protein
VTEAEKEQAKNTAAWLNSMSVAIASAGAIGPIFTFVLDITSRIDVWAILGIGFVCFAVAWIIHMIGHDIVGEIQ